MRTLSIPASYPFQVKIVRRRILNPKPAARNENHDNMKTNTFIVSAFLSAFVGSAVAAAVPRESEIANETGGMDSSRIDEITAAWDEAGPEASLPDVLGLKEGDEVAPELLEAFGVSSVHPEGSLVERATQVSRSVTVNDGNGRS